MKYTEVTALGRKDERLQYVEDIRQAASAEGWAEETLRERDGSWTLCFTGLELSVMLHVDRPWGRDRGRFSVPLLHWYGAKRDLVGVPDAWSGMDVNDYHHRKATSFPKDLNDTIARMVVGMKAANAGTAFGADKEQAA